MNKKFCLEGNISSGKTTLLKILGCKDIETIAEPLDTWQNFDGINLLREYYSDPRSYAFQLQLYILGTMAERLHQKQNCPTTVFERSIFSCKYVFTQYLKDKGILTHHQTKIFDLLFENIVKGFDEPIFEKIIYLSAPPNLCYDRLLKRARIEEINIDLAYLHDIGRYYDNYLYEGNFKSFTKTVEIVDMRREKSEIMDVVKIIRTKILG